MAQDTPETLAAAAAAPSLSNFFDKKKKKKIATTNLNKDTTTKPEAAKPKKKDAEDGEWQDEEPVVAATLKVDAARNLASLNEGKDEEDASGPRWNNIKKEGGGHLQGKSYQYPSLARSMIHKHAVGVHDDDMPAKGMTAKNAFSALKGGADSEDEEEKQTRKPAMAKKQKGEMERKAGDSEKIASSGSKAPKDSVGEEDDEEAASDDDSPKAARKTDKKKTKAAAANKADDSSTKDKEAKDNAVDLAIEADLKAAEAKYVGRRKLPKEAIPAEELEEEKVSKLAANQSGGKKKAFANFEDTPKLQYLDE